MYHGFTDKIKYLVSNKYLVTILQVIYCSAQLLVVPFCFCITKLYCDRKYVIFSMLTFVYFLFLEVAADVLDLITEPKELHRTLEEICIVSIPLISIVVEAGGGNKSLPLIVLETGFKGTVRNWSNAVSFSKIFILFSVI